ncbi:50S ribosomal protein L22 [Chitinivibrio alkaliphilus]|nr:50S ribosomal protein L22 [Chitinivibrio alkaliphilus]
MEAKALAKYIRSSAQKCRLVADEVRGKKVGDALNLLRYSMQKKVSLDVEKVIRSAVANLEEMNSDVNVDVENLVVRTIQIDEGPTLKRFRPRAQGRAGRINKRMCHIKVTVSSEEA